MSKPATVRRARRWYLPVVIVAAVASMLALGADTTLASPGSGHAPPVRPKRPSVMAVPQVPNSTGLPAAQHPLMIKVRGYTPTNQPVLAVGSPGGYTAQQLQTALGLRGTGRGQTVAVVDAFDDPYAEQDINTYSSWFGLPQTCAPGRTSNCFTFTRTAPWGIGAMDPGWALEESLDIDMVHALAPDAAITLIEAHDNSDTALYGAIDYAAKLGAAVISNSWGSPEYDTETSMDTHCALASAVCVTSTGDGGNPGVYPAYNPYALAVGGTTLQLDQTGAVQSETAWQGSGGGVSQYETRPPYQSASLNPNANRGIPDISFDADPNTGVAVFSTGYGGWVEVGGTSASAPAWAAILAVADQLRAAADKPPLHAANYQVQQVIYALTSGLADVTSGSNGGCGAICTASTGYDFVTGLGSPRSGIDTALAAAP